MGSSNRAASLGNLHGKVASVNVDEFAEDSPCARVYRQVRYSRVVDFRFISKVFQGGGLFYSCDRRRNRLEMCLKKRRNVTKKHCSSVVELLIEKKRYIVRDFFGKYS